MLTVTLLLVEVVSGGVTIHEKVQLVVVTLGPHALVPPTVAFPSVAPLKPAVLLQPAGTVSVPLMLLQVFSWSPLLLVLEIVICTVNDCARLIVLSIAPGGAMIDSPPVSTSLTLAATYGPTNGPPPP